MHNHNVRQLIDSSKLILEAGNPKLKGIPSIPNNIYSIMAIQTIIIGIKITGTVEYMKPDKTRYLKASFGGENITHIWISEETKDSIVIGIGYGPTPFEESYVPYTKDRFESISDDFKQWRIPNFQRKNPGTKVTWWFETPIPKK